MKAITQQFTGTTGEWQNANPRLYEGAWGFEITGDNRLLLKIGRAMPGNSGLAMYWNDLPYVDEYSISGLPEHLAQISGAAAAALEEEARIRQQQIDTEAVARAAGDAALQANINAEASARAAGDAALQANINAEASARAAGDAALQANINTEAAARTAGDAALWTAVNNETAARADGDASLARQLQTEASLRAAGDDAEAETRAAEDHSLHARIDELAVQTGGNDYAFNYLIEFLIAKFGPLNPVAMATESGDILVTEAGTRLIV
jgi:hypothetical protein